MKRLLIALLSILPLLATGCGTTEINKSSIPLGFGVDYKNGQVIFTTQMANPTSPEKGAGQGPQFVVQSATGATITDAARRVSLSNSQYPLWSQIGYVFIHGLRIPQSFCEKKHPSGDNP